MAFRIIWRDVCTIAPNGDTILGLMEEGSGLVADPDVSSAPWGNIVSVRSRRHHLRPYLFMVSKQAMVANFPFAREILESVAPGPVRQDGYSLLEVKGISKRAMEVTLRLAHGLDTPRFFPRPQLWELAVVAQELSCEQLFLQTSAAQTWVGNLAERSPLPDRHDDNLILEMAILSVFPRLDLWCAAAKTAIMHCCGPIDGRGLWISEGVIGKLKQQSAQLFANYGEAEV